MILGLLLGCPATEVPLTPPDTAPPLPPNVLLIVADDVGLDNISAYGRHADSANTPNLDALADQSVRFNSAWGTPSCSPARAQILTGRFGRRYGLGAIVHELQFGYPPWDLPEQEQTLGELARDAGYTTAFVGKWHLTSFQRDWIDAPGRHGFDRYRFVMGNLPVPSNYPVNAGYFNWERNDNGAVAFSGTYATTHQTDDALEELATLPEPWLMIVAYSAGHQPFHVPPAHLHSDTGLTSSSTVPRKYRAMVEAMDTEIGRLLEAIEPDTHLIFAADNGTPLEALLHPTPPDQGKSSSTEGGLQVPLLVRAPGVAPGVSEAPVQLIDLFPTVAAWMGAEPEQVLDGVALQPWLADPDEAASRTFRYAERFARFDRPDTSASSSFSVRDGRWKYKVQNGNPGLYDLSVSGWDTEDLNQITEGTADPAIVERMVEALHDIQANAPLEHTQ